MRGIKGEQNPRWNGGVSDYPNHYEMKKNRLTVLNNCNHQCSVCGGIANQVHHIDGTRTNHSLENLQPVCRDCHGKLTRWAHREQINPKHTSGSWFFNEQTLKLLRQLYGLTQKEVAKRLNVSKSLIQQWENGDKLPDVELLIDFCSVLGVPKPSMFFEQNVKPEIFFTPENE